MYLPPILSTVSGVWVSWGDYGSVSSPLAQPFTTREQQYMLVCLLHMSPHVNHKSVDCPWFKCTPG